VKPAHTTKPKRGRVLRTYTLRGKAGNDLSLVLEVTKTKKTLVARVLSMRYRGAKILKPGSNGLSYRWSLKKHKVRTLEQVLSLGKGTKRRKVTAKFDRRTNRTTITDPKRHKRPIKRKGLVALRFLTAAGKLAVGN
ncbi:MAG: hypothetical protein QOK04_2390, partial [Solirubrobacteraceae bacterium]|nr:hypothetical protein [Solirubrobacteraceae bacterium]